MTDETALGAGAVPVPTQALVAVSKEIAASLADARVAVESFVEQPTESSLMARCAADLRDVQGVLRVLDIHGGALLAEESSAVAAYLASRAVEHRDQTEALEALMRALVQLPNHVERVLAGGHDLPIVLLPLLNDLRAVRGASLLSEGTLMVLDLKSDRQPNPMPPASDGATTPVAELARRLRPRFQLGLVGWMRGERTDQNLGLLADVAAQVEQSAATQPVFQLWWVVGAVVEALRAHGLEDGVSLKRLVGLGDRELRRLQEEGEADYARSPPDELLNNLLFYVARASTRGPRVTAVRASFRLGEMLPADDALEQERENLSAPSVKLMHTVAAAIREDLAKVKDVLDIYQRRGGSVPADLAPQLELLRKIGDTLGVLGLGDQREIVLAQIGRLEPVLASQERIEESLLVDIAAALIGVEDRLDGDLVDTVMPGRRAALAQPADVDFQHVQVAVLRECMVNLEQVKELVAQRSSGTNGPVVPDTGGLMRGIEAGLLILGKARAVGICARIASRLAPLLETGGAPPRTLLEGIADAIVSLEYYMETLQSGREDSALMLDNAEAALAAADAPPRDVRPSLPPPSVAPPPAPAVSSIESDPELLAIFVEEAGEEVERIGKCFALWDHNPLDQDALRTVRRSFHTLKGSGRVVGAREMHEFAWATEDLLNHLLDGSVSRSPEVLHALREAVRVMPQLVAHLSQGTPPVDDIAALGVRAHALASGQSVVEPAPPPVVGLNEDSDAQLREIYSRETDSHVAVVRAFLERAIAEAMPRLLPEPVYRACHTLAGSSRMAEARHGVRLAQPLDHWLRKAFDGGVELTPEEFLLVGDCMTAMEGVSRHLDDATDYFFSHDLLRARIAAADAAVDARLSGGVGSPPSVAVEVPAVVVPAPSPMPATFDYSPDIASIFGDEATELLESIEAAMTGMDGAALPEDSLKAIKRPLHTLKGGARLAGIPAMGDLAHETESLITRAEVGLLAWSPAVSAALQSAFDALAQMRDLVVAGKPVPDATALIDGLRVVGTTKPEQVPELVVAPSSSRAVPLPMPPLPAVSEATPGIVPERVESARVDAVLLDQLLDLSGEVSVGRARVEQQLGSIDFNLGELSRTVTRLKEQLRKLEIETEAQILHRHEADAGHRGDFDPLELDRYSSIQQFSRGLAETAGDVASLQQLLETLARDTQGLLQQQGRAVVEMQNGLMRTRLVPFQRHEPRLARIVRQAAADIGRQVELVIDGAAGEFDRQILERMLPPLEHLLRNAVVHGIEPAAARLAAGKQAAGRITLSLRREGPEIVLVVADDGAGLDLAAIRAKAVSMGLVHPTQRLSDELLMQLVLEPGFSTAGAVTQLAGRGVGLDVVATEVKKLGGSLDISSTAGQGARFSVRLPFTLAVSQAIVVRIGEESFAIPLRAIDGVVRLPASEVETHLGEAAAAFVKDSCSYRLQPLGVFVGATPQPLPDPDVMVPVVLVRAGEHSTGLVVDELVGSREIVVKNVGPQIAAIRGISGATILGDGRIAIILDIAALLRAEWRGRAALPASSVRAERRILALVVDDSITVRRVTQRLLERNGMRVLIARDGIDAMAVLQEHVPDIILLDIEMPRMDGYDVAAQVRADPRTRDVPIIMITSRVGDKHRARAMALGVNDYLGKPYQEGQLLDAMQPLLDARYNAG
ncbi:MAG: hypothetical protein RLZZ393_499 [Pseudomonadota bacterium]|jgi:chemosensory pili system protein ChpA (sensor histidine kinase/response regulator)